MTQSMRHERMASGEARAKPHLQWAQCRGTRQHRHDFTGALVDIPSDKGGQQAGHTKVRHQHTKRVQAVNQDVGGPQVPVQDAQRVQVAVACFSRVSTRPRVRRLRPPCSEKQKKGTGRSQQHKGQQQQQQQQQRSQSRTPRALQCPSDSRPGCPSRSTSLPAALSHRAHPHRCRTRAGCCHGGAAALQQQLVVHTLLVVNGRSVGTGGAVALDSHRQPTLHILHEVHVPKGTRTQAAGVGQVGGGHERKPGGGTLRNASRVRLSISRRGKRGEGRWWFIT